MTLLKFKPRDSFTLSWVALGVAILAVASVGFSAEVALAQLGEDGVTTSTSTTLASTTTTIVESVDSAQASIEKIMYALIVVGVLLLALAVFYWWKTRPRPTRAENVYRRVD